MKDVSGDQTIEIVFQGEPDQPHQSIGPAVHRSTRTPEVSECDFHKIPSPTSHQLRLRPGLRAQYPAVQLRCCASHRYPARITEIIPGTLDARKNGRAHENSRATASTASAPEYCVPSSDTNRIADSNSSRDRPNSAPTRGSCSAATARRRRFIGAASHIAIPVQNLHSASKKSQPRACRPLLSVISDASEIMAPSFHRRLFSLP